MTDKKRNESRRILLGEVGPAHGIRGDVLIKTFTAEPEDIAAYGALEDETGKKSFVVQPIRLSPKGLIARIEGAHDRTAVEKLRGTKLYVARSQLPETAADEFYHSDLIGLRAINPSGEAIGIVLGVHNFGAGDLLEVKFDATQTTEFLPFSNAVAPEISLGNQTITIIVPEVLEEPDEPEGQAP